jgi:hypothetical protein
MAPWYERQHRPGHSERPLSLDDHIREEVVKLLAEILVKEYRQKSKGSGEL